METYLQPDWSLSLSQVGSPITPFQEIDWSNLPTVSFQEISSQIKSGDLIAFSGTSLKSKFLRIITNSPISHVGMSLILHNKLYLLHSNTEKGVCMDPIDDDFPFLWIQHDLSWTPDHFLKSIQVLPAGYDMKSIILTGILSSKLSSSSSSSSSSFSFPKKNFMCTDLVSYIWDLNQEKLMPHQIVEWFMHQAGGRAYFVVKESDPKTDEKTVPKKETRTRTIAEKETGIEKRTVVNKKRGLKIWSQRR